MELKTVLVKEIHGWKLADEIEKYDRETIFKYMNGAGEIYRLYGYKQLHVARYERKDHPEITVEVFNMGSSEDAYGVYTHSYFGEEAKVGQGAYFRKGFLAFWKAEYFVIVIARGNITSPKNMVLDLGKTLAGNIKKTGKKPSLVASLPKTGLLKKSIRYFHKKDSLNFHYFLSTENILNLDTNTDVVLAEYGKDENTYKLLIIDYKDVKKAKDSRNSFVNAYIPEGEKTGVAKLEDETWTAVKSKGNYLVGVLEAKSQNTASTVLEGSLRIMEDGNEEE